MRKINALVFLVAVLFVLFAPTSAEAFRLKVKVMSGDTARQVEVVKAWASDRPELKFIRSAVNALEEELKQRTESLNDKAKVEVELKREVQNQKSRVEELQKLRDSDATTIASLKRDLECERAVNHGFSSQLRGFEQRLGILDRFEDGQSFCRVLAVEGAVSEKVSKLEAMNSALKTGNKVLSDCMNRQRETINTQEAELMKLRAWCALKAQALYLWETGQPDPNPTPRPAPIQTTISSPVVPIQGTKDGPTIVP